MSEETKENYKRIFGDPLYPELHKPVRKGRLITFEGVDGTGKSTQLEMLAARMREEGYGVVVTKEPGSPVDPTDLGSAIRQILFHTVTTHNMARGVADCLFLADHIQHVAKVVEPALEKGLVVLSDRYSDSEWAYAPIKKTPGVILDAFQEFYGPLPDITVLFVASDVDAFLDRARQRRGDNNKQAGKAWAHTQDQIRIQQEYLERLVGQDRTIVITVYPEQTPGQVFQMVWEAVQDKLQKPVEYIEGEKSHVVAVSDAVPQVE
jgi:dTMP kinase